MEILIHTDSIHFLLDIIPYIDHYEGKVLHLSSKKQEYAHKSGIISTAVNLKNTVCCGIPGFPRLSLNPLSNATTFTVFFLSVNVHMILTTGNMYVTGDFLSL